MDVILGATVWLLLQVIGIFVWILIINIALSWLVSFNVVNTSNRFVYMVGDFTHRITEPALRPIRNILPPMGGFDLSPVALILLLMFVERLLIGLLI